MDNWKSWRWSRITKLSAWKSAINVESILSAACLICCLCIVLCNTTLNNDDIFLTFVLFCCVMFANIILSYVLGASTYFQIRQMGGICKVYIYKHSSKSDSDKYEVVLKRMNMPDLTFWVDTYDKKKFVDIRNNFIFLPSKSDSNHHIWMIMDKNGIHTLGWRVGKNIFVLPQRKDGKIVLNILDNHNFITIYTDNFICNNIYVPLEAEKHIKDVNGITLTTAPQEYLILKNNGDYLVYGIYNTEEPECCLLTVPSLIFQEGNDTVVLAYKNTRYEEIFRGASWNKTSSSLIVSLQNYSADKLLSGTIYRFNPQTLKLDVLYQGAILGIDCENGNILCDEGKFFHI